MATYFRKQMLKPVEEMERGNVANIDFSKAEIMPEIGMSNQLSLSTRPPPKKPGTDYNRDFEPDVEQQDQKIITDDRTGHIIGIQKQVLSRS